MTVDSILNRLRPHRWRDAARTAGTLRSILEGDSQSDTDADALELAMHPALAAGAGGSLPFFVVHDDEGGEILAGSGTTFPWPTTAWTVDHDLDSPLEFDSAPQLTAGFWLLGGGLELNLNSGSSNTGLVSARLKTSGTGDDYPIAGYLNSADTASVVDLDEAKALNTAINLMIVPTTLYQLPVDGFVDLGFTAGTMTQNLTWSSVWIWGMKIA